MIRHLVKLVWARKRSNALLILEIFVSFLVVFGVAILFVSNSRRFASPLGFQWSSTYSVSSSYADMDLAQRKPESEEKTGEILRELGSLPNVESVAAVTMTPFEMAFMTTVFEYGDRNVSAAFNRMTDDAAGILELHIIEGRWFDASDDALDWTPVVINQQLRDDLFPGIDALGKPIVEDKSQRVVGVVEHFRWGGELSEVGPAVVFRLSSALPNTRCPTQFLVRTAPGVNTAEFEELAQKRVKSIVPEWTITIKSLEEARRLNLRMAMVPIVLAAVIAGSLIIMVMLGMVGVFWQSVTARTHEIGLRRAMGSTRSGVYVQFLSEILIVTAIGAGLATLLIVQMPLLGLLGDIGWSTILSALGVAATVIALLSTVSGLYPAWIAARVRPVDALHDE